MSLVLIGEFDKANLNAPSMGVITLHQLHYVRCTQITTTFVINHLRLFIVRLSAYSPWESQTK